jgi:microcystin-dependent protein
MAVNLSPIGNGQQFFDNNGQPLNGGLIYTYQAGSTTPLASYTTINGNIANTNPIVLDASGRPPTDVWLTYGFFYKFVVKTSAAVTVGTYDNIYGIIGVQGSTGTTIPTGMISLWYGAIGSVPTGWYLCDGSNGTPDLRDRFIIGAGSSYAVNATGGVSSVTLTTSNMPAHTHTVTDPTHVHAQGGTALNVASGNYVQGGASNQIPYATTNTAAASTGITINTAGSGTSFSILNPYYALAYIMKA